MPNENEIINNYEETKVVDDAVVADEKPGMSTTVAMLIGAGVTLAVGAGIKLVKKVYRGWQAKKAEQDAKSAAATESEDLEDVDAK